MDRQWYLRFAIVVLSFVLSLGAVWPSVDHWIPAPELVKKVFKGKINPGLDIRGGMRLMYEVEVDEYIRDRRDRLAEQLLRQCGVLSGVLAEDEADRADRSKLEEVAKKCRIEKVDRGNEAEPRIRATLVDVKPGIVFHKEFLHDKFRDLRVLSGAGTTSVDLGMRKDLVESLRTGAVKQAVKTIQDRVDHLGLKEASVSGRDSDIIVEVPGAQDDAEGRANFDHIKDIISRTARLEFKIVDEAGDVTQLVNKPLPEGVEVRSESASIGESQAPVESKYLTTKGEGAREKLQQLISTLVVPDDHQVGLGMMDPSESEPGVETWRTYYLYRLAGVTGDDLDDAAVGFDPQEGNRPQVDFTLNNRGAERMGDLTRANLKRRMAIVLDDRVESAPTIQSEIGARGRITLGSSFDREKAMRDAEDLVVVLQAGALPAPLRPSNEQLVGPTLGEDSVRDGAIGAIVGIVLVLVFMLIYYEVTGFVADVMVILDILMILAIMGVFGATLTLPGIAAIALTVGMAVDANVLINERIREELRNGRSPRAAVDHGFDRAFSSIFDGHTTNAIAGVVLLQYGTGPIKGFATMLLIGVVTSLFTGVFCSKVMMDWIVRGLKVQKLRVG